MHFRNTACRNEFKFTHCILLLNIGIAAARGVPPRLWTGGAVVADSSCETLLLLLLDLEHIAMTGRQGFFLLLSNPAI